jgi:hypothetical protein
MIVRMVIEALAHSCEYYRRASLKPHLLIGALALVPGCIFGSCQNPSPPPADSCTSGRAGAVDSLEIGDDLDPFTPYHDGDLPHVIVGGQGLTMMGIRLRMRGADVPSCIQQATHYEVGGMDTGGSDVAVNTYAEPDGTRVTKPLWMPGEFGHDDFVIAVAGGTTTTVHLVDPNRSDPFGGPDLSVSDLADSD